MTTLTTDTEPRITARELAERLKCSTEKVYRMARHGEIPGERLGRAWRFNFTSVSDALRADRPTWSQSRRSTGRKRRA